MKRRDRSKQNKFNVLLAAGAVPASMRKEWKALKTAGSRKNQSKFIEDMVVRDDKTGRLALSCDKGSLPLYSQYSCGLACSRNLLEMGLGFRV